MMKKVLVTVVAIVMVFSLVACGGGSSSAAGTYKMVSMEAAGVTMDVAQMAAAAGVEEDMFNLVLNEDGTFEMNVMGGTGSVSQSGTWKASGNNLTLTMDGSDQKATLDGKKLTMEDNTSGQAVKVVFEKA